MINNYLFIVHITIEINYFKSGWGCISLQPHLKYIILKVVGDEFYYACDLNKLLQ